MDEVKRVNINNVDKDIPYKDLKPRFNFYSVFWFAMNLYILARAASFGVNKFFYVMMLPVGTEVTYKCIFNNKVLDIIFILIVIAFCVYSILRFVQICYTYIFCGIQEYGTIKREIIPQVNYRILKQLIKSLNNDDIVIGEIMYRHSLDRLHIIVKNNVVCSSLLSYIMLFSADYTTNLTNHIESFLQFFGIKYYSCKEEKKIFKKQVNKETEKLITVLLKDVEKLKDTANDYQAEGEKILDSLFKN